MADAQAVRELLEKHLSTSKARVKDIFALWDQDGNGLIDKGEFYLALMALGIDCRREVADKIFLSCDADGSGELDYNELNAALRRQTAIDASLRPGAAGYIEVESRNAIALRTEAAGPARVLGASAQLSQAAGGIEEQLRNLLDASWTRVKDLFAEWDADGSGMIDSTEFHRALTQMGLQCSREETDALFNSWDADGSGEIDYREMNKLLRKGSSMKISAVLLPGGAGEIEIESKNVFALRTDGPQTSHSRLLGADAVSLEGDATLAEQLAGALDASGSRVRDLFVEWDADGSGLIDKAEFAKALAQLGVNAERQQSDELFDTFDRDGSGEIDYRELQRELRQHASAAREKRAAERDAKQRARAARREAKEAVRRAKEAEALGPLQTAQGEVEPAVNSDSLRGTAAPDDARVRRRPMIRRAKPGKPVVPVRDRLLDLLPKISPRISETLTRYADADSNIDADWFVKGMLDVGQRPMTRWGEAPFVCLGANGRDARGMAAALKSLFGEIQQSDSTHGVTSGRVPIGAIPARLRKLRDINKGKRSIAVSPPRPPQSVPTPRAVHGRRARAANSSIGAELVREGVTTERGEYARVTNPGLLDAQARVDALLEETIAAERTHARLQKKRYDEGAHWLPKQNTRKAGTRLPNLSPRSRVSPRVYEGIRQRGAELRSMLDNVQYDMGQMATNRAVAAETGPTRAPPDYEYVYDYVVNARPQHNRVAEGGTFSVVPVSDTEEIAFKPVPPVGNRTRMHQSPREPRISRNPRLQTDAKNKAAMMDELKAELKEELREELMGMLSARSRVA
jgi:Ca2+-binding EF-hand superfamily protein